MASDGAPEEFDEQLGVVIEVADEADERQVASATVDAPDEEGVTRELALAYGAFERESDRTFETKASADGSFRMMVTPEENGAIALYLYLLEIHGLEESVVEDLADLVDMESYESWLDGLSGSDRRLRLLDQAEERAEHGAVHIQTYLDEGSWRTTGLTSGQQRLAKRIIADIDANPQLCYRNAYEGLQTVWENDRVTYVEGVVLGTHPGRIATHAWLEIDGIVAEVTLPWHRPDPPRDAVYFGVEVGRDELAETVERRNNAYGPALAPDDRLADLYTA